MQEQELQEASDACDAGDTHTHPHQQTEGGEGC